MVVLMAVSKVDSMVASRAVHWVECLVSHWAVRKVAMSVQ